MENWFTAKTKVFYMVSLEFYFPAPILMQYVDAISTKELREYAKENPVSFYIEFIKNTENDVRTSVLQIPSLRERYREYRNALYGLVLGKDVKLYFSRNAPTIPEYSPDELEFYLQDDKKLEELKTLKLRKYKVIERIIITDMLFRLYYDLYPKLKDILSKYREVLRLVKNFTVYKSARYALIERDFMLFDRHNGANVMNIYYPEQLRGFKSMCFPLMSWSSLIQLGMLHFFASGRWYEVNDVVGELKSYTVGGKTVKPNVITEPTSEFIDDCKMHYERGVEQYKNMLERFLTEVKAILEEKDPTEEFILSTLPASFFEIYEKAKAIGLDVDDVIFKLKDLIRRGVVKIDGDRFKLAK